MPEKFNSLAKIILTVMIPFWILISAVKVISTNTFLSFEYGKSDFPIDVFGFTPEQRMDFAAQNLSYVRDEIPVTILENQKFADQPLYNNREISHMEDVQSVFQFFNSAWVILSLLIGLLGLLLWIGPVSRKQIPKILKNGGFITAGVLVAIGLAAVIGWDTWFTIFHKLFFVPGSWTFAYTDTLIRLFPQKFWMDAVFTLSGLSIVAGLTFGVAGWAWQRFSARANYSLLNPSRQKGL